MLRLAGYTYLGGVAERINAAVLKTAVLLRTGGSNPSPSATNLAHLDLHLGALSADYFSEMSKQSGVLGSLSALTYAFTFMLFGVGHAPLYFALGALAAGLLAVATFRDGGRMIVGLGCLTVLTTLPVTFLSTDTFSGGFFLVHAYAAGMSWLVFVAVSWLRRLPSVAFAR